MSAFPDNQETKKPEGALKRRDSSEGKHLRKSVSEDGEKKEKKPEGVRWGIIVIILLFVGMPVLGAVQFVYDYINPEAAAQRVIYENVYRCYNAVGDIDKINRIDENLARYKGEERKLYGQLRKKYGMEFPECDTFRN